MSLNWSMLTKPSSMWKSARASSIQPRGSFRGSLRTSAHTSDSKPGCFRRKNWKHSERLLGNRQSIEQVILNLILNGVQAIDRHQPAEGRPENISSRNSSPAARDGAAVYSAGPGSQKRQSDPGGHGTGNRVENAAAQTQDRTRRMQPDFSKTAAQTKSFSIQPSVALFDPKITRTNSCH